MVVLNLCLVSSLGALLCAQPLLLAEIARLRHENAVLSRQARRVRLTNGDRLFLVWLFRLWPKVARCTMLVTPATLLRWHREGFRRYWRWRSRRAGRPRIERATIALIKRMARENPLWGAPRIHGELAKLGIVLAESTVAKYMPRLLPNEPCENIMRTRGGVNLKLLRVPGIHSPRGRR